MSGDEILLDTNAVIAWIKQEERFARRVAPFSQASISLFTLGELYFGALKSTKPDANRKAIDSVKDSFRIVYPGEECGVRYAEVRFALRRKGRPIPENDVWIASTALEQGLPLMTRDSHFKEVEGLTLVEW